MIMVIINRLPRFLPKPIIRLVRFGNYDNGARTARRWPTFRGIPFRAFSRGPHLVERGR